MNTTHIRRSIRAAHTVTRPLAYRALSGLTATLVETGRLIRTGDLLDRLGATDLTDGHRSWYGRHVATAYRKTHDGAQPLRVWAQHRTTGRWVHVFVYSPADPALYAGLRGYKRTAHLAAASLQLAA